MQAPLSVPTLWQRLNAFPGILALIATLCFIAILSHRAIVDQDIWLHLKTGELILQAKSIPTHDPFSFALEAKPWVDHEWLFQVLVYLLYNRGQAEALILLQCLLLLCTFGLLALAVARRLRSATETALLVFLAGMACLPRFTIRPELFSLLCFTAQLYLLFFYSGSRLLWLSIPLQVLWVNLHGYFFLGPLLLALCLVAESVQRTLSPEGYRRLGMVCIASLCACLLNPRGIEGWLYPLAIARGLISGGHRVFFTTIAELRPTFTLSGGAAGFYYVIAASGILLFIAQRRHLQVKEMLFFVFFLAFSLVSRNVAFFVVVGTLVIASCAHRYAAPLPAAAAATRPQWQRAALRAVVALTLTVWVAVRGWAMLTATYYDFASRQFKRACCGVDERQFPRGAVEFLRGQGIKTNVFNDFNSGAYLIGRAWPAVKVFIDGRTELYGGAFYQDYRQMLRGNMVLFKDAVRRYQIGAVLLTFTYKTPLIALLYQSPEWKLAFFDHKAAVFLRNVPEYAPLLKSAAFNPRSYVVPQADLAQLKGKKVQPSAYVARASFLYLIGEDALAIAECQEALRIKPDSVEALYRMGKALQRQGRWEEAVKQFQTAVAAAPHNHLLLMEEGLSLYMLKRYSQARSAFVRVVQLRKNFDLAHFYLGCIALELNDSEAAIGSLQQALRYASFNPLYHLKLSEAFFIRARLTNDPRARRRAEQEFERARQLGQQRRPALSSDE